MGSTKGVACKAFGRRAEAMAGKLAIQSENGQGVSISIILPLDSRAQNHEPLS